MWELISYKIVTFQQNGTQPSSTSSILDPRPINPTDYPESLRISQIKPPLTQLSGQV